MKKITSLLSLLLFTILLVPSAYSQDCENQDTMDQPSNQIFCNSENTAAVYFTGGEVGNTYSWSNDTPSIGLAANGTTNIPSFIAVNNGTTPITANIYVTEYNSTCDSSNILAFTIKVNPTPQADETADQTITICDSETTSPIIFTGSIAGTTYNWTNNTPSIGLAASGTGDIASFIGTNNGTSPLIATITVTPIFAGCAGDSKTFTITVNPPNVIMNQPSNQEVCSGSDLSGVSFSSDLPGTTYNWTASYPGILDQSYTSSWAGSGWKNNLWQSFTAGHTARLSRVSISLHKTNTSGTLKIYSGQGTSGSLLYSGSFSASTGSSSAWVDIPIASPPTITKGSVYTMSLVTSSDTMWASLGENNYSGGISNLGSNRDLLFKTYIIQNDFFGLPLISSGTGDIPSFTASNVFQDPTTNSFLGPAIVNYTVTPELNGCFGTPKTFSITINPLSQVVQPQNQVVCNSENTAAIYFTGGEAGTTYSWTNNTPSIGLAASGTGDIASFIGINNGTSPVTANITVSQSADVCNSSTQRTFTITVNPTTMVNQPSNQVLCNLTSTEEVGFSGGVAGTTYNWTNNTPSIGLAASGTGDIASFIGTNNGTSPLITTITVTPIFAGCAGDSKTFTITVNPPNVIMNQPSNQEVCSGSDLSGVSFSSDLPGTTYNWTASYPGILDQSYTSSWAGSGWKNNLWQSFTAGHTARLSRVSISLHKTNTSGTLKIYSGQGTSGSLLYSGSFSASTGSSSAWVDIPIASPPTITKGSVYTMSLVTSSDTMWASLGENNYSGGISNLGSNRDLLFKTYIIQNDFFGLPLISSGTGDIPSFTASNVFQDPTTNSFLGPAIVNYTVTPELNGCFGTPKTFSITINPLSQVVQPQNQVVCNSENTAAIYFTGGEAGTTYSWTNNTPSIGLAASGTGDIASFIGINNGTSPVTANITVSQSADVCNSSTQRTFTITVNPTTMVNQPSNQVLCNLTSTEEVGFSGGVAGTTYNWTNNTPSIGLAASGTGDIASFIGTNNGTSPLITTITVTPIFAGCAGDSKTFTITVNPPNVIMNQPSNQEVCSGSDLSGVSFSSDLPGTTYNWTASYPGILDQSYTSSWAGSGWKNNLWQSFTAGHTARLSRVSISLHKTNTSGTLKIYSGQGTSGSLLYSGSFSASTGSSSAWVDIPIASPPTITKGSVYTMSLVTSSDTMWASLGENNYSGGISNLGSNRDLLFKTYIIQNDFFGLPPISSGTGDIPSFTASNVFQDPSTNSFLGPAIVNYTVTPELNGCFGTPKTFSITINNYTDEIVNPINNQTLYSGETINPVIFSGGSAGTIYSWENDNPSIGLAASGIGNIGFFEVVSNGLSPVTANIIVTPLKGSCAGEIQNFTITVNPPIPLTITGLTGDDKVYDGSTVATVSGTPSLSGVEAGDDVSLVDPPTFTFASPNVGTDIIITSTGYTLSGVDAGDYTLIQPSLSADITSILGLDDFLETTTSLKLFPNPAIEYIQISGLSKKVNYTIYNILGKKVLTGNVVNDEGIYIQILANGLYLLKFNNGNTIKFTKK